jgi:hypothetical protein
LPLATNALRAPRSDTVEVLASADTTALEKASSISLSLKFVIYKKAESLLSVRDYTKDRRWCAAPSQL